MSYTFALERKTPAVMQVGEGSEVYGVIMNSNSPVLVCCEYGVLGVAPEDLRETIIKGVRAVNQAGRLSGKVVEKAGGVIRVDLEFITSHVIEYEDLIRLDSGEPVQPAQLQRTRDSLLRVYERFMDGEEGVPFELSQRADGRADVILRTPSSFRPAAQMLIAWPHPAAKLAAKRSEAAA